MKKFLACVFLLNGLAIAAFSEEEKKEAGDKVVAIVYTEEVGQQFAGRLNEFVSLNLGCRIREVRHKINQSNSLDKALETVATTVLGRDDICALVVTSMLDDKDTAEYVLKEKNVALLNEWAFRPSPDLKSEAEKESHARRVEKESMRLLGQLLALNDCPMPRCAMYSATGDKELDAKGRNFCPPCQGKAQKMLTEKGAVLSEGN